LGFFKFGDFLHQSHNQITTSTCNSQGLGAVRIADAAASMSFARFEKG
jgi:hypothetical protein